RHASPARHGRHGARAAGRTHARRRILNGRPPARQTLLVALVALAAVMLARSPRSALGDTPAKPSLARAVTFSMRTMGTYANVTIVTDDSAAVAPAARVAQRVLARVDSLMSNWTTTSEVARLNRDC